MFILPNLNLELGRMRANANTEAPKPQRKTHRKVKTGCKTCRIRRVKCDENKPDCSRCANTGRTCEWYIDKQDQLETSQRQRATSFTRASAMVPLTALPNSGDDMQYLEFYYHCVGPRLSGRHDTDFWLRTILQMAHDEPSVRSALVALGHLNKSQKGSLQHARQFAVAAKNSERRPFLLNYNKAIRQLINDMARPSFAPEQGLVICLLFACIEFLQADANVAFTHIRSGLNIFHELRQRGQLTTSSKSLQEAHGHIIPARLNPIEQILVQILTQSLASAMPYGMYLRTDFEYLKSCPKHFAGTTFASLGDARSSFSDIRNAAILLARDLGIEVHGPEKFTLFDRERQYSLVNSHRTWLEALTNLECSRTWSRDEMTTLSAMKVEYYSSFTACSCLTDWTQMTFDALLADFQSLLVHARHVVDALILPSHHTQNQAIGAAAHFTFVTSFVPSIFNFAIRCRCPITRREAVKILASDIPREGLWDPAQYRKVAERVIEIEESGVDDRGWPTQASRLCRSTPGPEVDEFGGFQVEFQYANDWATSNKNSWSERLELDTGAERSLALRLQDVKAPHPQQP